MAWRLHIIIRAVQIFMVLVIVVVACNLKIVPDINGKYWQNSTPPYFPNSEEYFETKIVPFYNQTLTPPGVLVNLQGGIGNQLYQYACSYSLAQEKDWPLYVSLKNGVLNRQFTKTRREFALDQFHIPQLNMYDKSSKVSNVIRLGDQDFFERNFSSEPPGFIQLNDKAKCQSPEFWRNYTDQIRTFFQPNENILRAMTDNVSGILVEIKSTESVAVHVRRGDFLQSKTSQMPISYQRTAIARMVKVLAERNISSPAFYVFSDDINYTKKQFTDFETNFKFVYASDLKTTSLEDFYLMTQCKHIIVPNSTFSWWAAYLNRNEGKVVIRPKVNPKVLERYKNTRERKWYTKSQATSYFPKDWIMIDPFSGGVQ